jgi:hypothetical protein
MSTVPVVNLALAIERGTDFESKFIIRNSDGSLFALAGYTAIAKIRKHPTSQTYKSFVTTITTATSEIKIQMDAQSTAQLNSGRNYYDVVVTAGGKYIKVYGGSVIVTDTISLGTGTDSGDLAIGVKFSDLADVDTTGIQDSYIVMYDSVTQTYKAVNPDEVLSKAATEPISPGLPDDFEELISDNINVNLNLDAGNF